MPVLKLACRLVGTKRRWSWEWWIGGVPVAASPKPLVSRKKAEDAAALVTKINIWWVEVKE